MIKLFSVSRMNFKQKTVVDKFFSNTKGILIFELKIYFSLTVHNDVLFRTVFD